MRRGPIISGFPTSWSSRVDPGPSDTSVARARWATSWGRAHLSKAMPTRSSSIPDSSGCTASPITGGRPRGLG